MGVAFTDASRCRHRRSDGAMSFILLLIPVQEADDVVGDVL